jgi:hypothetical protein
LVNWLTYVKRNANSTRTIIPAFKKTLQYVDLIKAYINKNKAKVVSKDAMSDKEFNSFNQ